MKEDGNYCRELKEQILINGTIQRKIKPYPKLKLMMDYQNLELISKNEASLLAKFNFQLNLIK
jgi:hypothetical protein